MKRLPKYAPPAEYRFVGWSDEQKEKWIEQRKESFEQASKAPAGLSDKKKQKWAMEMKLRRTNLHQELEKKAKVFASEREVRGIVFKRGQWVEVPEKHSLLLLPMNPHTGEILGLCKMDALVDGQEFEKKPAAKEQAKAK
jgi:hypothetical protein